MKAQLTFDLSNEEDKERFQTIAADKEGKLRAAMWAFAQETLRKYRKYGGIEEAVKQEVLMSDGPTPESMAQAIVEHIEKRFYQALEEYEVTID